MADCQEPAKYTALRSRLHTHLSPSLPSKASCLHDTHLPHYVRIWSSAPNVSMGYLAYFSSARPLFSPVGKHARWEVLRRRASTDWEAASGERNLALADVVFLLNGCGLHANRPLEKITSRGPASPVVRRCLLSAHELLRVVVAAAPFATLATLVGDGAKVSGDLLPPNAGAPTRQSGAGIDLRRDSESSSIALCTISSSSL